MPHPGQGPHHLPTQSCLLLRAFQEHASSSPTPPGNAGLGKPYLGRPSENQRQDIEASLLGQKYSQEGEGASSCLLLLSESAQEGAHLEVMPQFYN